MGLRGYGRCCAQRSASSAAPGRCHTRTPVGRGAVEHPAVERRPPGARPAGPTRARRRSRARQRRTGRGHARTSWPSRARRRGLGRSRSASLTPNRSRSSAGQVDAVQAPVLAHVADEVRELERDAEAAEVGVMAGRDAEQRGHDPADGAGRAVHVGRELLVGVDPDRRLAVHAHRAHVVLQLAEREVVAVGGVGRARSATGWRGAAQLRLPGVQRGAALRGRRRRGAGRRRADRPRARSRRARRWRDGRRPAGGAWRGSTWGRADAACAAPSRTPRCSAGSMIPLGCTTVDALLRDRSLLYVTGKGGVGKTTVAAALGLAAARTGRRTIVCEVAEQDRMSRAFARQGVRPEQEVAARRRICGRSRSTRRRRWRSGWPSRSAARR